MKVVVTGLRGFPNIQGGIEKHCEELYPRIQLLGCDINITVVRRKGFIQENPPLKEYKNITFKDIKSPKIAGLEAVIHTLRAVWYAYKIKADIIHIHAIGPALVVPIAKVLGLKVIVTHHGPDYNREKWSWGARSILKFGEYCAAYYADEIIAISTVITDILKQKYNRVNHISLIYNGISTMSPIEDTNYIKSLNLTSNKYILAVGRFVEEKRFDKLIQVYLMLKKTDYKLVIVGDADYNSSFSQNLKHLANQNQIVLTGILTGIKLQEIYTHAALFVLPSSHEGLPITLLEAMSFKRKILASDIPANLAVKLPQESYFKLNDMDDFLIKMEAQLNDSRSYIEYDLSQYDWDFIAKQVFQLYLKLNP